MPSARGMLLDGFVELCVNGIWQSEGFVRDGEWSWSVRVSASGDMPFHQSWCLRLGAVRISSDGLLNTEWLSIDLQGCLHPTAIC